MRVLKEGTELADRYTLIRRLGTGGMSEVWLAGDRRSESSVALKFLSPELASKAAYRELFRKEWQTGIRLMHPHIARVFEYYDDADGPFYSQQFIEGPDIGILAGQPLSEALKPFGLIADALRYAHGKGVVHRDVKAGNILFDRLGSPHLIDFGVAARVGGGTRPAGYTTIAASPEQRAGAPPAPADDIHALGVLLHETVFGRPPDAQRKGHSESLDPVSTEGPALPGALQRLLEDMRSANPERRPTAEEVGRRLRETGIEPGLASLPAAAVDREPGDADLLDTLQSIRPSRRVRTPLPASAAAVRETRGVSPKFLYGGLAALAVIFVLVFYWLPNGGSERANEEGSGSAVPSVAKPEDQGANGAPSVAADDSGLSPAERSALKDAADEALGELLSALERLRLRAIDRWGGQPLQDALAVYKEGDKAYLDQDYRLAGDRYRDARQRLQPFFDRIDGVFNETMRAGKAAFGNKNHADAVRLFDLAVAITPGDSQAEAWLKRARNQQAVLALTDQGVRFEKALELNDAKLAFEKALKLDPKWQPAADALDRVVAAIRQRSFEQRMTEGLNALAAREFPTARAAFKAAKALKPDSQQPVDGLLQVDQEVRLSLIRAKQEQAEALESSEQWPAAAVKYQEILDIDSLLQFAREGLARANRRAALDSTLAGYIAAPDSLSAPATLQAATNVLLEVSRMSTIGPRLEKQKDELARLLKRAATALTVQLVSDNATEVSIFKVGRLGTFATRKIQLRPGTYVAKGSRDGFRDVRLEFRVAPEIDPKPIVIVCEERI